MKKYTKPSIEEFNIGATTPLMASGGFSGGNNEGGASGEYDAPTRKDKDYDFDDEGW